MKNNVLAVIPARGGSKGIKNKNIISLNGQPLISYTIKSALGSDFITDTIVSTDSERIKNIAIENGALVPFIRPDNLSTDSITPESWECWYDVEYTDKNKKLFVIAVRG